MATPMSVSIVSPEEAVWEGEAELVIARSPEGEFGIMHNHIPFLAALVPGAVTVVSGGTREVFLVTGGFLEANSDGDGNEYHVIVLADDAEATGEVTAEEIQKRVQELQRERELDRVSEDKATARLQAAMAADEVAASRGQR